MFVEARESASSFGREIGSKGAGMAEVEAVESSAIEEAAAVRLLGRRGGAVRI